MAERTKGQIHARGDIDNDSLCLVDKQSMYVVDRFVIGPETKGEKQANADFIKASWNAADRLGLTAEQLDAGVIDELVKSAKKVITLMNEYNKPPKERNPLILAIDKTRVREGLESALSPFEKPKGEK